MSEGQPTADGEGVEEWRDLSVFLESSGHQRRGVECDEKMKAHMLMTLLEETSVTDSVWEVVCVGLGRGYGRDAVGEVGGCWLSSAGVGSKSHGGRRSEPVHRRGR